MSEVKELRLVKVTSQVLSFVFFPGMLPVYGLLVIFNAPTIFAYEMEMRYSDLKQVIFMLAFINMTVIPLAIMPLFKYRKIISDYSMSIRGERIIPLSFGCLMYVITTIIFFSFNIPQILRTFVLAATITTILTTLITTRYKISVHAAGMGSLLATTMVLSVKMYANLAQIWIPIILLAGMVMTARLYLRSHKPSQIYSGFALGFAIFWITMNF
jgi:hypothetical protein